MHYKALITAQGIPELSSFWGSTLGISGDHYNFQLRTIEILLTIGVFTKV
jgi:hypothetical protein